MKLRHPILAVVLAVLAFVGSVQNAAATTYAPGEEWAPVVDITFGTIVTWLVGYGVVLVIDWAWLRVFGRP